MCSMSTGHCSTQAPHVVQDHRTSGSMTPFSSSVPISGRSASARAASGTPASCSADAFSSPSAVLPPPASRYGALACAVAQRHDQEFRREGLAGVPGGALRLAATALRAGGEVEDALPGELLDLRDAVDVVVARVLEVDLLAVRHHRLERAQRRTAVGLALEPDVREGEEAVPGDAHGGVEAQGDGPDHRHAELDHGGQVDEVLERAEAEPLEGQDQRIRDPVRRVVAVDVVQGAFEAAQDQDREADGEDHVLDEVRLPGRGAGEARLAAGPRGQVQQPDGDQYEDAEGGRQRDELDVDLVRQEGADVRDDPVGLEELAVRVDDRQPERQEADGDEPVREAHDAPAVHPRVAEELLGQGDRARSGVVGATAGRYGRAELHEPVDLGAGSGDERDADHGQHQRHDDRGELHWGLLGPARVGRTAPRTWVREATLLSGNLIGLC